MSSLTAGLNLSCQGHFAMDTKHLYRMDELGVVHLHHITVQT